MTNPPVTGARALWNYVYITIFNLFLFTGVGAFFVLEMRPLEDHAYWAVPTFAVGGLIWGLWLARRVNQGKEDLG